MFCEHSGVNVLGIKIKVREAKYFGYCCEVYKNGQLLRTFFLDTKSLPEELQELFTAVDKIDAINYIDSLNDFILQWRCNPKQALAALKRRKGLIEYRSFFHNCAHFLPRNTVGHAGDIEYVIEFYPQYSYTKVLVVIKQAVLFTNLRTFITLLHYVKKKNRRGIIRIASQFSVELSTGYVDGFLKTRLMFNSANEEFIKRVHKYVQLQKLIVTNKQNEFDYVKSVLLSLL